jgi:hypothetical protein
MKKIYLVSILSILAVDILAQSMNENFEAYTAGSYMGNNSPQWSTWSGSVGGAEDTQVSTATASSGTKSIYFVSSSSGGGPQDVIVPFGGAFTTRGSLSFETKFYVVAGKGAYFQFSRQRNNRASLGTELSDGSNRSADYWMIVMETQLPQLIQQQPGLR